MAVNISPSDTISELKSKIFQKTGTAPNIQIIIKDGIKMRDGDKLVMPEVSSVQMPEFFLPVDFRGGGLPLCELCTPFRANSRSKPSYICKWRKEKGGVLHRCDCTARTDLGFCLLCARQNWWAEAGNDTRKASGTRSGSVPILRWVTPSRTAVANSPQ